MCALGLGSSPSNNTICQGFRFYPVICSSNIQLKLQVENHLHIVDHGITFFLHHSHICSHFQYETISVFFSPKLSAAPFKTGFMP